MEIKQPDDQGASSGKITDSFSDPKSAIKKDHDFKALLEAIPDMVFRLDRDGTFVFYKGDAEDLYISPDVFLGKRIHDVMPEPIINLTMTNVGLVLSTGKAQIYEYKLAIPDKVVQHYECRMVKYGEDGVLATVRNITSLGFASQQGVC